MTATHPDGGMYGVAARAYAMDHQAKSCLRQLDHARDHITAATSEQTLVHFYNIDLLNSIHGLCLLTLDQPAQAVEHSSRPFATLDPKYVRNVAFNAVYLGMAQLGSREIDAAVTSLTNTADPAAHNRSSRLIQQIQSLRSDLIPWTDARTAHDINERSAVDRRNVSRCSSDWPDSHCIGGSENTWS